MELLEFFMNKKLKGGLKMKKILTFLSIISVFLLIVGFTFGANFVSAQDKKKADVCFENKKTGLKLKGTEEDIGNDKHNYKLERKNRFGGSSTSFVMQTTGGKLGEQGAQQNGVETITGNAIRDVWVDSDGQLNVNARNSGKQKLDRVACDKKTELAPIDA
jgi:hypothetical protein